MSLPHARKLLALLASSAWLLTTVTCDPADFSGVVSVVGVPADVVVVDDYYYDDCCGWGDFHFDWWGHHDDDDD